MRRSAIGICITTAAAAGFGLLAAALLLAPATPAATEQAAVLSAAAAAVTAPEPAYAHATSDSAVTRTSSQLPRDAGCVIVALKRTPTAEERSRLGLVVTSDIRDLLVVAAAPAGMTATEYAATLSASDLVEYAEPDHLLAPAAAPYSSFPNDLYFRDETAWTFPDSGHVVAHAKSWPLRGDGSANFDQVWPALANDKAGPGHPQDVRVAVIDTGFYFEGYADLADPNNIHAAIDECATYTPGPASKNTTDTDVTPVSEDTTEATSPHGTMVASQIGQGTSNYTGSSGAAWDTRVDVYKIQGIAGATYGSVHKGDVVMPDSALVKAIYDAVDDAHAKGYRLVINLSLVESAGSSGSTSVRNAVAYARRPEHDAVIVAAAGNEGNSVVSYPAAYPGVIAVGASAMDRGAVSRASFSNYGTALDVLAPGAHVWGPTMPGAMDPGTLPDDIGYRWWDGTSMAAPYVSAAAALLLRVEPSLTATEVETYLTRSAVNMGVPGRDNDTGWGRLDAYAAYLALTTPQTTSDARTVYADGSTMTLSVTDRDSGNSVTTYFSLDGDLVEGRVVTFRRTESTWHTLQYWSVDSNGVTERAQPALVFQVLEPDLLAPVTSSDATRTYAGEATVHLTAHDPSPGWIGPEFPLRTYYRLDSGSDTTGTALVVGSSGPHTLRYWSVDYAGNTGSVSVATFTVTPLPARVTISRTPSTIMHGAHVHLSGTLAPARAWDTVSIQVKTPGSHVWRNFTGYVKYYRRAITTIDLAQLGRWSTLAHTLRTHGRYYFRAVYAGDSKRYSRASATSATVSVLVR
jgi:hypothetical protein